jgi:predicted nucleic acid-binding protein
MVKRPRVVIDTNHIMSAILSARGASAKLIDWMTADYLVTKNIRHFPYKSFENVKIIRIKKFLDIIESLSLGGS